MKWIVYIIVLVVFVAIVKSVPAYKDSQNIECMTTNSCSACLTKSFCKWCVTKSKCTKQSCGNDNIIYPKDFSAIMAGAEFCPRVVEPQDTLTIKSGDYHTFVVRITQIHLYMAFTPWNCKVTLNGKQMTVPAVLLAGNVFCESVKLAIETNEPYVTGSVAVTWDWDYSKSFDGSVPFNVCRCDLDPTCTACNMLIN